MHHQKLAALSFSLLLMVSVIVAACAPAAQPGSADAAAAPAAGEETAITVSGAFALFPLMTLWAEEYQKVNPNVQFDIQAGGAGKGMTDMLTGAADIAMLSRDARQEELDQWSVLVPVTIDSVMWAKYLGAEAQEDLKGTAVNGDPGLAEAIRQDKLGLGYNNVGFAYDPSTGQPPQGALHDFGRDAQPGPGTPAGRLRRVHVAGRADRARAGGQSVPRSAARADASLLERPDWLAQGQDKAKPLF